MPHTINLEEKSRHSKIPSIKDEENLYKLISILINNYNNYNQIELRVDSKCEIEINDQILGVEENEENILLDKDEELRGMNIAKSELFHSFIDSFDELSIYVHDFKQNNFQWLKNVFQIKKLPIIHLYEFVNKLLKLQATPSRNRLAFKHKEECINNSESKVIIIKLALQLLHILTTNLNSFNEDDELSTMCCEQLARSFDFVNSICGLLINHLVKTRAYNSSEAIEQESLLNSSSLKIAFNVLNKLTSANKLFNIDLNVKELCHFLVNSVQSQAENQSVYLQFLSNILRNNPNEIEQILKNLDKIRPFCRQLINNIQNSNQNPNMILNSLIIFNKLNIGNMFSVLWPKTRAVNSKNKAANELENYKIFDSIDLALTILCNDSNGCSRSEKFVDKPNELVNEKINALNFLYDFLNCETIRQLLEKNQDHMNIILLKLNQIIIENGLSESRHKLYRIPIKIFEIFNELATNSECISAKLFQIIFNTKNFIESETNGSKDKTNQLTKKIKKLYLTDYNDELSTSNRENKNNDEQYLATDYYLKLSKLPKVSEKNSNLLNNASLKLKFFIFLNTIFKNNLAKFGNFGEEETPFKKLEKILFQNIEQITAILNNESIEKNLSCEEEYLLGELNYSLLNLLDTLCEVITYGENFSSDLAKKLFGVLTKTYWPSCSFIKPNTNINEISSANNGNTLIISQILLRLLKNNQLDCVDEIKEAIYAFFKNENYIRFIWFIIIESQNIKQEFLAYEIFDNLKQISKTTPDLCNAFSLQNLLKSKYKMQRESKNAEKSPIVQVKYSISSNFTNENKDNLLNEIKSSNDTRLTKLLEFYDHKLKEQIRQQTQMMNTLNECFSNSLLSDMEHQKLRDELKEFVKIDEERKKQLELTKEKLKDSETKFNQISKSFNNLKSDLDEKNEKLLRVSTSLESKTTELVKLDKKLIEANESVSNLTKENQKNKEECEKLKLTLDETISSNTITLENLQRVLATEKKYKEESQNKVQKFKTRLTELEETNKLNENSKMELELKLKEKNCDYEKLKNEYDKIQGVLSYIKANT